MRRSLKDCVWPWPKAADIVFEHRNAPWTTKIIRTAWAHLEKVVIDKDAYDRQVKQAEAKAKEIASERTGPYEPPMVYAPKQGKVVKLGLPESDTPRTDAEAFDHDSQGFTPHDKGQFVEASFARELERKVYELTEMGARLVEDVEAYRRENDLLQGKCHADTLALRNLEWAFAAFVAERGGIVTVPKAALLWDYEFTRTIDANGDAAFTARAIGKP